MQELEFVISFALGSIVCTAAAVVLVARWELPWREALVWFGLISDDGRANRPSPPVADRLRKG
jgi:hypothetical protein